MDRKPRTVDSLIASSSVQDSCWVLPNKPRPDGYVRIKLGGVYQYAHRVVYQHFSGQIPEGFEIDHLCRVRNCINPEHLEAVTPMINMHRSMPYNPKIQERIAQNVSLYKNRRTCKLCKNLRQRKYLVAKYALVASPQDQFPRNE